MRATEFINETTQGMTISIPINITIPAGGGMPQIGTIAAPAGDKMPDAPLMIPPFQQELELLKQQGGRKSPAINQIINQNPEDPEDFVNKEDKDTVGAESESDQMLALLKKRRERLEQP